MSWPAPQARAACILSMPMLPWPKTATESPGRICAVSTPAMLSLSDCRVAASLSEMRSSTLTSAMAGSRARSAKQPGSWKPMIGPRRQSSLRWEWHMEQSPQGSLARAATRSPGAYPATADPTSTIRAQNSWPKSWSGASVSSRLLMWSYAKVGIPKASWASVALGWTTSGSTSTWSGGQAASSMSSSRMSPKA